MSAAPPRPPSIKSRLAQGFDITGFSDFAGYGARMIRWIKAGCGWRSPDKLVVAALMATLVWSAHARATEPVDLELVLAMDVSSSVDDDEYFLQAFGLAQAFRHPDVISAIQGSTTGGIAVALVQWADANKQALAVDWTPVWDAASAYALSERILNAPRLVVGGQTSISGAISFSVRQIEQNGYDGWRQTIDVSGDGRANSGTPPMLARDRAVEAGITVNGLAILNEEPFVDHYYEHSVIGGEAAFMIVAGDYEDFSAAMIEKLIREIGVPLAEAPGRDVQVADAAGER